MTPSELNALCDIKRTLERIKDYCENCSFSCDSGEYRQWKHVASEVDYGLIKVKDIERSAK